MINFNYYSELIAFMGLLLLIFGVNWPDQKTSLLLYIKEHLFNV